MRVHVCVFVIKGLPYEDTSCESRNTQQHLSMLSKAHAHKLRETQKTEAGEGGGNRYDCERETQSTGRKI